MKTADRNLRLMRRLKVTFWAAMMAAPLFSTQEARGALIIDFEEVGGDVVATAKGSVNLAGLTSAGNAFSSGCISPAAELAFIGSVGFNAADYFTGISGPSPFGTGGQAFASSGSGDLVGFSSDTGLYLPMGYTSGALLSSTSTWTGQSFATLGLTPGTYTATWGSGPDADTLTLNIGAPVPESGATLPLMVLGLLGLVAAAWKSQPC